jgi:hypothetical protein
MIDILILILTNVAIVIATVTSCFTTMAIIKRHNNQVSSEIVKVSTQRASDFSVGVKLWINSLILIALLIMYDVTLFLELFNFAISDKLFFFIGDLFAWVNPIILILSSGNVRSLFGLPC